MDRFEIYSSRYGISPDLVALARGAAAESESQLKRIEEIRSTNQLRVLRSFTCAEVGEHHLHGTTGYGYGDASREVLGDVYAQAFGAETALVVPHLVSGTHAITACLFGLLRPGDELVYATGSPYDTLVDVIGLNDRVPGSLADFGVTCRVVDTNEDGSIDLEALSQALSPATKVVAFQRSCGYAWQRSRSIDQLRVAIGLVKRERPGAACFVDNCYGEFVEEMEPCAVGADLIAGSLIKNPGGGLALTGGYIAGRRSLVELAATRVTAPGVGGHVGAMLDLPRLMLQGFYLAPHFVAEALSGAVFAAHLISGCGLSVNPPPTAERTDLVLAVKMPSEAALIGFCRGLQSACPINGHVQPEPGEMPGYEHKVVMAGGGFVQGATLELSADAPIREPYIVYMQGGLTREQVEIGVLAGLENLRRMGVLAPQIFSASP